jgi:hypothetical protein
VRRENTRRDDDRLRRDNREERIERGDPEDDRVGPRGVRDEVEEPVEQELSLAATLFVASREDTPESGIVPDEWLTIHGEEIPDWLA